MKRKKSKKIIALGVFILGAGIPMAVMAHSSSRAANIASKGNLKFGEGEVCLSSSDLVYLAKEIDQLENTYKVTVVDALNSIGTYFKTDGSITRDAGQNEADTEEEKRQLSFGKIAEGIRSSQSVESLSQRQAVDREGRPLYFKSEEAQGNGDLFEITITDTGFPILYRQVSADHMSAGAAAWVDGALVMGNGYDNVRSYEQGWQDGREDMIANLELQYTYHIHTGNPSVAGGCYGNIQMDKSYSCTCSSYYEFPSTPEWTNPDKRCGNCAHGPHDGICGRYVSKTENAIGLICGKTTDTIEDVTVVY